MPCSADLWYDDAQIHKMHHLMWVWCKDSDGKIHKRIIWCDDAEILMHKLIKKCDDAQILGKRERDGTKLGEMQINRESTRRVHRCPASPSHHFRILSNSYRASELHKIASCVCRPCVTRFPSYLWQLGKNYFMCSFSIWKKVQKQDNQRRDNTDRI